VTDRTFFLGRDELFNVFGNMRAVMQFETLQERVATSSEATEAIVADTQALRDATFITLSANSELSNERVLTLGPGLSFDLATPGQVRINTSVATEGGWPVQFSVTGATALGLPVSGFLATRSGQETLSNKTLAAPRLSGLVNAVDDTAAASAGVPVGGVYRNGSALQVRVT